MAENSRFVWRLEIEAHRVMNVLRFSFVSAGRYFIRNICRKTFNQIRKLTTNDGTSTVNRRFLFADFYAAFTVRGGLDEKNRETVISVFRSESIFDSDDLSSRTVNKPNRPITLPNVQRLRFFFLL